MGTFHLGECCFSCLSSYSAALSTTVRKHLLFYCSFERSPDGSRGPWGRGYCRRWADWEWRVSCVEVLIRCEGWSTSEKGVESRRSVKKSCRRWRRRNLRILWRSIRLYSQTPCQFWWVCSTAAEPLFIFYSTAQTNGRAVTLRYWKRLQLSMKKEFFPYAS